jgi:alpha-L-fucosidase 2
LADRMRTWTFFLALLSSAATSLGAGGQTAAPAAAGPGVDRYDVVWDSPSADHHGSMPLGNGDIALNAWMTASGDLHFYISKTDAWDDSGRLVKVGKVRLHFESNPVLPGLPFRQVLKLGQGAIEIQAGKPDSPDSLFVRLWVDALNPVIHITVGSAVPREITAFVEPWRTGRREVTEMQTSDIFTNRKRADGTQEPIVVEPDTVLTGQNGRIGWFHRNVKSVGPALMAELQGVTGFRRPDPLLGRTFGAMVTASGAERLDDLRLRSRGNSHHFDIYVLTRHPATPDAWLADMDSLIRRVGSKDVKAREEAHRRWWREFWGRSWIRAASQRAAPDADDAFYVSRMYHLQRFITACAGRGAYPIKFNGSLFTVPPGPTEQDPDFRRWGPGYWWQNTRLPYISLSTSGDTDLMRPLFRMYAEELLPLAKYRTKLYLGHEGAYYPECIYFWGDVFSETYGWTPFDKRTDKLQESRWHKWEWVGGLELCWMMLDYYDHTGDGGFLGRTAVPFAREILTFFDKHYFTAPLGKLVMRPSQALETWWDCTNPMPEVAGSTAVAERLLALPGGLVKAPDRELCRRLLDKLPPIPTRDINGKKALAPAEAFAQKSNVENPELYAVFPFRLFAFDRPAPEWAVEALRNREDRGNFGWRQDDIFMAYLGLTRDVRESVVGRARTHDPGERFPAFWGPNYDWTPDQDHGGVLMKAFQAMVLQTDGRRIFLLPAWPKDWDVEFRLRAPEKTVIEGVWRGGAFESLKVTPESRRADITVVNSQ